MRMSSSRLFQPIVRSQPPIVICPYLYESERDEIRINFRLSEPSGQRLEFFLWQDVNRIGPEHAFEHCWKQFPDRDIIIVHSDMAPMPEDVSNEWYDALVEQRNRYPDAGMLGCNLFSFRSSPKEPLHVWYAGGIFRNGEIDHLHGPVKLDCEEMQGCVPKSILQRAREVAWCTFAGVLIRREVIRDCGDFDRRYQWAYVMDVDYSLEARKRDYHLLQVPVALQHYGSRTTSKVTKENPELKTKASQNFQLFYEKWRPSHSGLLKGPSPD